MDPLGNLVMYFEPEIDPSDMVEDIKRLLKLSQHRLSNTDVNTEAVETAPVDWRDYYELTKPRVILLIVFTAIVGMFLSVPGWPGIEPLIFGTLGIGMASSAAAVFNHVLDHRTDILMMRTRGRPLPQGKLTVKSGPDVCNLFSASLRCLFSGFSLIR